MKKTILILSLFIGLMSQAQFKYIPGVRTGLNISSLSYNNEKIGDYKKSFFISFVSEFQFNPKFSIIKELSYSIQGANNVGFIENEAYDIEQSFISDVILSKIKIKENVNLQAGIFGDFLVNDSIDFEFDFGLIVGAGYTINNRFDVDLRYKYGLVPVRHYNESSYYGGYYVFNIETNSRVIQLGITYKFKK
jgi:Outer membrane protein beta-barrel domain